VRGSLKALWREFTDTNEDTLALEVAVGDGELVRERHDGWQGSVMVMLLYVVDDGSEMGWDGHKKSIGRSTNKSLLIYPAVSIASHRASLTSGSHP